LRSNSSPLVMNALAPAPRRRRPRTAVRLAPAIVTVGLLGALSVFGVLTANGAIDAGAAPVPARTTQAMSAMATSPEDAAVTISPAQRPAPSAVPVPSPPPPFLRASPVAPPAPRSASAAGVTHAAFVAVSVPAPPADRADAAAAVAAVPEE